MGNGLMNKLKSLFNRKKNENDKENNNEKIKVEKEKHDLRKIEENEIKPKLQEKKTTTVNYSKGNKTNKSKNTYRSHESRTKQPLDSKVSNENRIKNTRKNDKPYSSKDNNKKQYNEKKYNEKKSNERKIDDNKSRNSKYNPHNVKQEGDKKNHISEIENLLKDITVGMEFEGDSFKGEIIKKQSYNLSYTIGNGKNYILTYKELLQGFVQKSKTGSIDEKWYEANFNNVESSNLKMISAILNKYITTKRD